MKYWARRLQKYQIASSFTSGFILDGASSLAVDLIHQWGMVAGASRKDDAASDANPGIRLLSPEEVVTRAFAVADVFMAECEKRGSILVNTEGRDASKAPADIQEAEAPGA